MSYVSDLARAAVFGARDLELEGARRFVISVPTANIGLLEFDMAAEKMLDHITEHRRVIRQKIDNRVFWRQLNYTACQVIHDVVFELFDKKSANLKNKSDARLRVAIMLPHASQPRALQAAYTYNFGELTSPRKGKRDDDPRNKWDVDDRIWVPIQGSVSGAAYMTKNPRWHNSDKDDRNHYYDYAMNQSEHRYRNKLHWEERTWIYAIPIYYGKRSNPNGKVVRVVVLDSNIPYDSIDKSQWEDIKRVAVAASVKVYQEIDYFKSPHLVPQGI